MNELMDVEEINKTVAMEGDYKKFTYKDIECEIKRVPWSGHLCGYLHTGGLTDKERDIVDYNFYFGITYEQDGVYGFDCAHFRDIMPNTMQDMYNTSGSNDTYKTMGYVENILKETIDELKKREKEQD